MVNGDAADPRSLPWKAKGMSGAISITVPAPGTTEGEGIHPGSSIEWWFVHGSFSGPDLPLRHFMVSIFRYDLTREKGASHDGYYAILQILDPVTGKQSVTSRGESRIVDDLIGRQDEAGATNLDRDLVDTYIEEIRSYGPPRPITLLQELPEVIPEPFSFAWQDIRMAIDGTGISLGFLSPGEGSACRFRLEPRSARFHMENIGASPYRAMTYVTRPCLGLSGMAGDVPVTGTAWYDHQWGNSGWFLEQPGGGNLHGWDWIGISGADGTSWILLTFRDMESGTVLTRCAYRFDQRGEVRAFSGFSVRTLRSWTSPATRIEYPVAMEIHVPEAEAWLSITPLADDQEIPVLGFMRAVWEGAATCTGSVAGVPFSGSARTELQGYGYIFDFQKYISGHIDRIRDSIDGFLPPEPTAADFGRFAGLSGELGGTAALDETIVQPCRDLLMREKKYWRPVFALLLLETLGVRSEQYRQLLSVVPELTHTGTLIIDDIEDNAEVRRGDTCIHRRYGTDVAINAANTLYFLPSVLYGTHPDLSDRQRLDFYRITLDSFVRGHFGQAQDIWWTRNLSEENLAAWAQDGLCEKILQMYGFKTAAAAVAMAEAGCILAGSPPRVRVACTALARAFGTAFQIADDIQSFGQPAGNGISCDDIAAGKVTYVLARALALLDPAGRDRLIRIVCSPALRSRQEIQEEGIGLVRRSGALEACRAEALAMTDDAWHAFSLEVPASEPKVMLRLFLKNLLRPSRNTA